MIVEAHLDGRLADSGLFDYERWRADAAPPDPLREVFALIDESRRQALPQYTSRVGELESLYARGDVIDPLIAEEVDFALASGDCALYLLDGRNRTMAAARAGVEELRIFVLR